MDKKVSKKDKIKNDLLEQLKRNGINGLQYVDLIEDYMELWNIKNKLIKDIKKRGVNITYKNGENQYGFKKNDSINELNKTSSQMLKILSELGLKPIEEGDGDDEM